MTPDTEFTEFVTDYLNDRKDDLRSIGYVKTIMNRFAVVFCKHRIGNLRRIDIRRYIQKRRAAGIAPNTINLELAVLSAAIRYVAHRWEIDLPNPISGQRLPATPPRVRYLTTGEALRLCEAAEGVHPVLRPFIEIALNTGCRKTELLKTRWEHIDMIRRVLILPAENTKTQRTRSIPLNQKAFIALDRLREWQCRNGIQDSPWLFSKSDGNRLAGILVPFQKAREKAGITDFTVHDLRHTFASWLVMSGVELIKVRDLLGHTTIAMTERYAHLATDRLFDAVSVLDRC
jgi:integrase